MTDEHRPQLSLKTLADVEPEHVQWLWPGYMPKGKIVTLDGDPGLGKSTLALNIGAIVSTAGTWPDGSRCEHPGDVLLMSAEDGVADTTRPRCDAAGADVARMHVIEGKSYFDPETGQWYLRSLTLADVADIADAMARVRAALLVVDVLMAFLPTGTDSHRDQDIRRVLSALATAADDNGCTVLLLRHLNKAKGGDPLYRGGGSIGIVGAARSGLLVASDPDDPTRRILASVKSNLGVMPSSLSYRLVDSPDHGVARIEWEGASTHTAHSVLADSSRDDEFDEHDYTDNLKASWLYKFLAAAKQDDAKVRPTEAVSYGGDQGQSRRSVFRLFDKLRNAGFARSVDAGGFPKKTYWEITDGDTAGSETPSDSDAGTTGTTGPDQAKEGGTTAKLFDTSGTAEKIGSDLQSGTLSPPAVPSSATDSVVTRQAATVTDLDSRRWIRDQEGKPTAERWFRKHILELRNQGIQYIAAFAVYEAGLTEGHSKSGVASAAYVSRMHRIAAIRNGTMWWCIDPDLPVSYKPVKRFVAEYLDALPADVTEIDQNAFYEALDAAGIERDTGRKTMVRSGRIDSRPAHGQAKSERIWIINREEETAYDHQQVHTAGQPQRAHCPRGSAVADDHQGAQGSVPAGH